MYSLFDRHILFSVFMPLTFETVHPCFNAHEMLSWQPHIFYIWKPYFFFHIYAPLSIPCLAVIFPFCEKWPFQDHLATKTIVSTQSCISQENDSKLSTLDLKKWAESSPVSLRNGLFMTILQLNYHINSRFCLPGERFKGVSWENGSKLCLPKTWTNDPSLPQYHWEMSFSRPSCHQNYHIDSKLLLPRPEQERWSLPKYHREMATKTSVSTQSCVFQENGSKLCLPETWTNKLSILQYHK